MRSEFVGEMLKLCSQPEFVFLTGDLGFGAFEELERRSGHRFINAGVAEQNMVSVSAGLAKQGLRPWVYSIGPFLYARALEQIRNDVSFHSLGVRLVANGGGLGYGVMGPSHLSFDDYGILGAVEGLKVFIPCFPQDVAHMIREIDSTASPTYLRLSNTQELNENFEVPAPKPWRRVMHGSGGAIVTTGSLVVDYMNYYADVCEKRRPSIWALAELPIRSTTIPSELVAHIQSDEPTLICEEHLWIGGIGMQLTSALFLEGISSRSVEWRGVDKRVKTIFGSRKHLMDEFEISPNRTQGLWDS